MKFLRRLPLRIWRLFVDDGRTVVAMLAWVGVGCLVLRRLPPGWWSGPLLFAGIAAIALTRLMPPR